MSERSPTLEQVLRMAIGASLSRVHTALPARVEKYDAAQQKVQVKPLVQSVTHTVEGADLVESVPIINDVPVVFPRAGGFFLSFPIQPGDHVLLICNERSIDEFSAANEGTEVVPLDSRQHNLSDAVALVGFYPFQASLADASEDNLVIGKDGGIQQHITQTEIHLGQLNPAEYVALATKVLNELNAIKLDFEVLKALLISHVHPGVLAGSAVTQPSPAFAAFLPHTPAPVAATKVKAL